MDERGKILANEDATCDKGNLALPSDIVQLFLSRDSIQRDRVIFIIPHTDQP